MIKNKRTYCVFVCKLTCLVKCQYFKKGSDKKKQNIVGRVHTVNLLFSCWEMSFCIYLIFLGQVNEVLWDASPIACFVAPTDHHLEYLGQTRIKTISCYDSKFWWAKWAWTDSKSWTEKELEYPVVHNGRLTIKLVNLCSKQTYKNWWWFWSVEAFGEVFFFFL